MYNIFNARGGVTGKFQQNRMLYAPDFNPMAGVNRKGGNPNFD